MEFNLDTIKQLSPQRKAIAIVILLVLLGYAYYFFFLQATMDKKAKLTKQQVKLEKEVTEKSRLAAQKDRYLKEVAQLQENLKMVLMKLPNEREIPDLFQSVAVSGKNAGIEFVLFEPQRSVKPKVATPPAAAKKAPAKGKKAAATPAEPETFYDEIPLKIAVNGNFHNVVLFFEKVANLPRIINIENITMTGGGRDTRAKGKDSGIKTSCLMKTYMFLEKKDEKKN
jgi:type IV pilus assembly protein PilO